MGNRGRITKLPVRSDINRPSSDNWHPNFPDGTVRVSFIELSNDQWRVCVWGADDCGMERDFNPEDREDAMLLHQRLAGCSDVTKMLCSDLGMVYS